MGRDLEFVLKNYFKPLTNIVESEEALIITGQLIFNSLYIPESEDFRPFSLEKTHSHYIEDQYDIQIKFSKLSLIPEVTEIGERLISLAKSRDIRLIDLHYGSYACLSTFDHQLRYQFDDLNLELIVNFIDKLVIPFFYSQSYFEKFNEWPWENLTHGILGLIEELAVKPNKALIYEINRKLLDKKILKENKDELNAIESIENQLKKYKIRGHRKCICGSKRKFRNCHKRWFEGLVFLKKFS